MSFQIILHIGINKTGSSTVQRFLHDRRQELLERGILYPQSGCTPVKQHSNHHELSRLLGFGPPLAIDKSERAQRIVGLRQSLLEEISDHGAHTVVISTEFFMLPRPIEPVKNFFAGLDIKLLVYLRRHDSWRESAYGQGLKTVHNPPNGLGFEEWLSYQENKNSKYGNYRLLLDTWSDAFGKSNLIVRPYEKQQNQPDIVTDFLKAASLEDVTNGIDRMVPRVNEGLSRRSISLLERFQRLDVTPQERAKLVKHACSLESDDMKMSIVSPSLRLRMVEDRQNDYEYIAREYLGREDGRLFYDPLPDMGEPWHAPQPLTAEEVAAERENALAKVKKWNIWK